MGDQNVQVKETMPEISIQTGASSSSSPDQQFDKGTSTSADMLLNSPQKIFQDKTLRNERTTARRQIQILKKQNQRPKKRIAVPELVFKELKAKNLLEAEDLYLLQDIGGSNEHILKPFSEKSSSRIDEDETSTAKSSREYSPELKTFALTLQYHFPQAYNYVRKHFDTWLPNPKITSNWYRSNNGDPGFIIEAFTSIAERVKIIDYELVGTLIFDAISLREHSEYDGEKFSGYLDFGNNIATDDCTMAREAFVFLFVCMNSSWEIPVGYFFSNVMNSDQICNLTLQCLTLLHNAGARVVALSFDGIGTNLTVAKKFSCNLDPEMLHTHFLHPITQEKVFLFPDLCRMIWFVRIALEDKKVFLDENNQRVEWKFVTELDKLPNNERLLLANKLRSAHNLYLHKNMKVQLGIRPFSTSVVQSLKICREDLKLPKFEGSSATEIFLQLFNDLLDIFNSKNMRQIGLKRPMNTNNYIELTQKLDECRNYIINLRLGNGEKVVGSNRNTGFVGFLVRIESLRGLYRENCVTAQLLKYIPTYKLSHDHLELFFGCIRSQVGRKYDPTTLQFKAAIRKLLIRSEIRDAGTSNCVLLQNIATLHVSSTDNSETVINTSTRLARVSDREMTFPSSHTATISNNVRQDDFYIPDIRAITEFSERIIAYMAGIVVRYLTKSLHCDDCVGALTNNANNLGSNLRKIKSWDRLQYPSVDVIRICTEAEKIVRFSLKESGGKAMQNKFTEAYLVNAVLSKFVESELLFKNLHQHTHDQDALKIHDVHLTRAILSRYINIRLSRIDKQRINKFRNLRRKLNKLLFF